MRSIYLCFITILFLAACGGGEAKWASDADVAKSRYANTGPTSITLFTVLSVANGSGQHTGLLIRGSENVIFDPAGTWQHPRLAERNDVHFGMSPVMEDFYIDYHARETYDVVKQTILVSPEVAELAMRRAMSNGAVGKAQCSIATSGILRDIPGFESLPHTYYPKKLMEAFGKLPGVQTRKYTDTDTNNNHGVLLVQAGDPRLK